MSNRRLWTTGAGLLLAAAAVIAGLAVFHPGESSAGGETVAVTTSWLECVLRDVTDDAFEIVRLCPPGSCPGHFDMTPTQLASVRHSGLLVRFDFQSGLDAKLMSCSGDELSVVSVPAGEGLCVPASYLGACRELARAVSARHPYLSDRCRESLARIEHRLESLSVEVRGRIAAGGLKGTRVLTSHHQAAFARWLGLDVVGTLKSSERETVRDLAGLIDLGERAGVVLVVANLQEGAREARALARRLGARVVVFSNFPAMDDRESSFDALLRANVDRLLEAAKP